MSRLLNNEIFILLARVVLGAVFIVASVEKIADPSSFATSIDNYRIISGDLSLFVATAMPWVELLCGFGLLFGILVRGSSLLTLLMLLLFTGSIVSGLLRGLDISCGCFTQDPGVAKIGWGKVAENTGLMALACCTLVSSATRFTLERFLSGKQTGSM